MNIDKKRVLEAFNVLSNAQTYQDSLAHAMMVCAYIVDASQRIERTRKRRVELKIMSSMLKSPYKVIIEEISNEPERILL